MGLKQREHVRRRDLAPTRYLGESDPALVAQVSKSCDAAAGARMIRRANDLERFGKQQFVVKIA